MCLPPRNANAHNSGLLGTLSPSPLLSWVSLSQAAPPWQFSNMPSLRDWKEDRPELSLAHWAPRSLALLYPSKHAKKLSVTWCRCRASSLPSPLRVASISCHPDAAPALAGGTCACLHSGWPQARGTPAALALSREHKEVLPATPPPWPWPLLPPESFLFSAAASLPPVKGLPPLTARHRNGLLPELWLGRPPLHTVSFHFFLLAVSFLGSGTGAVCKRSGPSAQGWRVDGVQAGEEEAVTLSNSSSPAPKATLGLRLLLNLLCEFRRKCYRTQSNTHWKAKLYSQ